MYIKILNPQGVVFEGEIELAQFPGSLGSFQVLQNHAPLISTLEKGEIRVILPDKAEKFFPISGGIVEVRKNDLVVLITEV
jgi:F-type H+-transporting ATPase subunit epsilon